MLRPIQRAVFSKTRLDGLTITDRRAEFRRSSIIAMDLPQYGALMITKSSCGISYLDCDEKSIDHLNNLIIDRARLQHHLSAVFGPHHCVLNRLVGMYVSFSGMSFPVKRFPVIELIDEPKRIYWGLHTASPKRERESGMIASLDASLLPTGVRAHCIQNVNSLTMHAPEAGPDRPECLCVLLLHGFPELTYSWRKVMPALVQAGSYGVAPDQHGYGRTSGWDPSYNEDLGSFRIMNLVRDMVELVAAIGHASVAAVMGHDFGASVAARGGRISSAALQS